MDLYLNNKTVVITGGSRGIGRAMAEQFADEGANVAICARNEADVNKVVQSLERKGVKAMGRAVDITDYPALEEFIRDVANSMDGIDVLVANASCLTHGNEEQNWRMAIEADLMGTRCAVEAARPWLESAAAASGDAAIVITSSMAATETDSADAYGALKAALIHYTKGVAREGAPKQVRCNAISPGTILFEGGTWAERRDSMPEFFAQMIAINPMGRMGTAEEIAASAVFLASPRSSFTTGVNLVIDGAMAHRVNF